MFMYLYIYIYIYIYIFIIIFDYVYVIMKHFIKSVGGGSYDHGFTATILAL